MLCLPRQKHTVIDGLIQMPSSAHFSERTSQRERSHQMNEANQTIAARDLLAAAVKHAESIFLLYLATGKGKQSVEADPYIALVALATHTGLVLEGDEVEVRLSDLLGTMRFIATDPCYTPDPHFPWTKAQLAAALRKEGAPR